MRRVLLKRAMDPLHGIVEDRLREPGITSNIVAERMGETLNKRREPGPVS